MEHEKVYSALKYMTYEEERLVRELEYLDTHLKRSAPDTPFEINTNAENIFPEIYDSILSGYSTTKKAPKSPMKEVVDDIFCSRNLLHFIALLNLLWFVFDAATSCFMIRKYSTLDSELRAILALKILAIFAILFPFKQQIGLCSEKRTIFCTLVIILTIILQYYLSIRCFNIGIGLGKLFFEINLI